MRFMGAGEGAELGTIGRRVEMGITGADVAFIGNTGEVVSLSVSGSTGELVWLKVSCALADKTTKQSKTAADDLIMIWD